MAFQTVAPCHSHSTKRVLPGQTSLPGSAGHLLDTMPLVNKKHGWSRHVPSSFEFNKPIPSTSKLEDERWRTSPSQTSMDPKVVKLYDQIDQVADIMNENLQNALKNYACVENLEDATHCLHESIECFERHSGWVKRRSSMKACLGLLGGTGITAVTLTLVILFLSL